MNLKQVSFWLVIASLFANEVPAQEANSLLWKIEAPHLSKPSYLYGTMHSRDKRAHQFGDSVLAKLNACDAVALELLIGEAKADPFAMLQQVMMTDTTLDMLLSPEDYNLVKAHADKHLQMFSMMINNVKPIFTSMLLTEGIMREDEPMTVDEYFEQKAQESGKHLIGIETMEEQMSALEEISLKEQAQMLVEQVKSGSSDSILFEQLMQHYVTQNLNEMMKIYQDEEMPEMFDEALVVKRNKVMAHRIDSIIRMQSTFNAVGALHLAGDQGLVALLRKKGYQLSPVISRYSGTYTPKLYFPDAWVTFKSKEGKFSVDFPAMPDENEQNGNPAASYTDADTKTFFIVTYQDLTKEEVKKGEGDYEIGIKKMQEKLELVSKKEITYAGMKALDSEFKVMPGMNIRYHFLLVKNRMYIVSIGGSTEFINSAEAEKFFNSFKLN